MMRFSHVRCTSTLCALLFVLALPVAAAEVSESAVDPSFLCPAPDAPLAGLVIASGKDGALATSDCTAFCTSDADCEEACPGDPDVTCDTSTSTCESGSDDGDSGSDACTAFCTSDADCEEACPDVSGVFCDTSNWTCSV